MRWLLAVLLAGCGAGDGTDGEPAARGDAGATARLPAELPHESLEPPLDIERLDELRFVVDRDALVQLGIEHDAGRLRLERAGKVYAVASIAAGSTAARLGLLQGDVIRGVNNVEMTGPDRLQRAWSRVRRDEEVKLMVERDGAVIELEWIFARSIAGRIDSFRSSLGDRDRSTPEYAAVVQLARAGLVETALHRYTIERAVLVALRDHPRLGDRRLAGVWTARGARRGVTVGVNSIYTAFGLGRFDVVNGVGAADVRSPSTLQQLIAARAGASELSLEVVRLDRPVVLRYRIVDGAIDRARWTAAIEAWNKADADSDGHGRVRQPPADVSGIRRISDARFELEPMHLKAFQLSRLRTGVRMIPAYKNGKADGLKLYAIRPTSTHALIGLRNGDTVRSIAGVALTDITKITAVERALRTARSFRVELTRRGKPLAITYVVKR